MCELSANGEYKLPTTETERILSFKPTDIFKLYIKGLKKMQT